MIVTMAIKYRMNNRNTAGNMTTPSGLFHDSGIMKNVIIDPMTTSASHAKKQMTHLQTFSPLHSTSGWNSASASSSVKHGFTQGQVFSVQRRSSVSGLFRSGTVDTL